VNPKVRPTDPASVIADLEGLIVQATKEKSHYYVASVAKRSVQCISSLKALDEAACYAAAVYVQQQEKIEKLEARLAKSRGPEYSFSESEAGVIAVFLREIADGVEKSCS